MKKIVFVTFFILMFPFAVFAQTYPEGLNIHQLRAHWFFDQRKFPDSTIPLDAYSKAIRQKDSMRTANGYFDMTSTWTPLGPSPGNYTGYSWGNIAGRCQTIHFDISRDPTGNTVYVVGSNGGLWKSTNAFATNASDVVWTPISWLGVPVLTSGNFTIDPNPSGNFPRIYYGTGEDIDYTTQFLGDGIYITTNDGQSWTKASGLPNATKVFKIAIRPNYPDELLAALGNQYYQHGTVDCGLYRSVNAGLNWSVISGTEDLHCTDVMFDPTNDERVYLVGAKGNDFLPGPGYRISTDGGVSWEEKTNIGLELKDRSLISISQTNPNVVFILTGYYENGHEFVKPFKSIDYGEHFELIYGAIGTYTNFNSYIKVCPSNPDLVLVGGIELHRSINGGSVFNDITHGYGSGNVHVDHHNMEFYPTTNPNDPNASKTLFTSDGGIYRSTNCGVNYAVPTFENLNKTLNPLEFYRLGCDPFKETNMLGAALDNGLQHKTSSSSEWAYREGGDYSNVCFNTRKAQNLIHIGCKNGTDLYASFDGGYTPNSTDFTSNPVYWVVPMVYDPNISQATGYGAFYSANSKVCKSTDGGLNWVEISNVLFSGKPVEQIGVSESNPNVIYAALATGDYGSELQRFYRTMNGGVSWTERDVITGGLPNRRITSVKVDPINENEVFVTLSGFVRFGNQGEHVYKSTNYGDSWSAIEKLANAPANDILIQYTGAGTRRFFAATDIGVYAKDDNEMSDWKEFGPDLPNAPCLNLQLNEFSQKLRVGTFGIGAWEIQLDGPIYVNNTLILESYPEGLDVKYDIIVCAGGKLFIPDACTINMAPNTKIVVQNEGSIDASNGNAVTFRCLTGTWGGIEFQSEAYGTLNNITFSNTSFPIVVTGFSSLTANDIIIDHCHFSEGQVLISERDKVRLTYNDFTFTNFGSDNSAIFINGSSEIDINNNTITFNNNLARSTGISANYSTVFIQNNTINKSYTGIYESNCNSGIDHNTIVNTSGDPAYAYIGIELVNCYSTGIKYNTVTGYQRGIYLFNSSPVMLQNNFSNTNTSGSEIDALHADYFSSPRLTPLYEGNEVVLDAGENTLLSTGDGNGIKMDYGSWPIIDYGYNTINGQDKYITGTIMSIPIDPRYFVRCNYWQTESPDPGKFTLEGIEVIFEPYVPNCPGGGGEPGEGAKTAVDPAKGEKDPEVMPAIAVITPPNYIIVDRGYGHFDTLLVHSSSISLPADQMLYMLANKEELLGNFSLAINKYKQVVSNYQDSLSALNSLRRIITCYDRISADTNQYSLLRDYYLNLAQSNQSDSAFYNIAKELAAKTLVRKTAYPQAITEYEDIIESSTDSSQILCAELNIIQTYMLISQQGDAPSFTGKLSYLKPNSVLDGYKKMQQLLHGSIKEKEHKIIPKEFALAQNYPNPFNPITTIGFSLPQNTKVVIKVYDILGRLVKELVNEYKTAGVYNVKFDGTNFSSGVYFYKIEAGTFVDTKKMVLVK